MIKRISIILILSFPVKQVCSQSVYIIPKNYPGICTALVFGNISTTVKIENERYMLTKTKLVWAVTVGYWIKRKQGICGFLS